MPESQLRCPSCKAVLKLAALPPVGKSVRCPKCRDTIRVPADDEDEREDEEKEETRPAMRPRSRRGSDGRRRKKRGGPSLGLWLGIGGGVVAAVMVVLVVLGGKKGADQAVDKPGTPAPEAREGGGSESHHIERRIETTMPLPQREPFILIRGILSLGGSADAGVIAVTSALSPRKYTLNRTTGK